MLYYMYKVNQSQRREKVMGKVIQMNNYFEQKKLKDDCLQRLTRVTNQFIADSVKLHSLVEKRFVIFRKRRVEHLENLVVVEKAEIVDLTRLYDTLTKEEQSACI